MADEAHLTAPPPMPPTAWCAGRSANRIPSTACGGLLRLLSVVFVLTHPSAHLRSLFAGVSNAAREPVIEPTRLGQVDPVPPERNGDANVAVATLRSEIAWKLDRCMFRRDRQSTPEF